jgi:hypothetical protein
MKKGICLLIVMLTTSISSGQTKKKIETKPKDIDKGINFKLDSLSKVYKMIIYSYGTITEDGVTRHFVTYIEGNKLKEKIIPKPVR